jgi:hypothetical protein
LVIPRSAPLDDRNRSSQIGVAYIVWIELGARGKGANGGNGIFPVVNLDYDKPDRIIHLQVSEHGVQLIN